MDTPGNPILQVLDDYKAAVFAKDIDSFIALYDEDVRVFDMWGAWSYAGIAAWRAMAERWFRSLDTERVVVEFSHPEVIVTQDLAVVHTFVTYKAVTADGVDLRSLDNRLTAVLRQRGNAWKIVHEHTSAPLEAETAKVIFKRE
jgi:ketosteroid isomerase-like protein